MAAFSTCPHGLRKIMYTDYKLGSPALYKQRAEPSLAQRTFEESNPFNDPDARNCLAYIDTEDRYLDSSYIWTEDATVIDRELSKHVRAAGKVVSRARTNLSNRDVADAFQTEWPVVLTTFNWSRGMPFPTRHHHGRSVIAFKVPSTEDTFEFADTLRHQGLRRKDMRTMHETPDGSFRRLMDEWWCRFLLRLPKEQKYW